MYTFIYDYCSFLSLITKGKISAHITEYNILMEWSVFILFYAYILYQTSQSGCFSDVMARHLGNAIPIHMVLKLQPTVRARISVAKQSGCEVSHAQFYNLSC